MLLVIVDQSRVRRRGQDAVEGMAEIELPGVAVEHLSLTPTRALTGELFDPSNCVERVTLQKVRRSLDRPAGPSVLVAPVLLALRQARKVEIEVGRPSRRARGSCEHHAQDVTVLVVVAEVPER